MFTLPRLNETKLQLIFKNNFSWKSRLHSSYQWLKKIIIIPITFMTVIVNWTKKLLNIH